MRNLPALVTLLALSAVVPADAQQAHVILYDDLTLSSCEFVVQPPVQVRTAYLVVEHAIPFMAISFTTVPPTCSDFSFVSLTPAQGLHIAIPGDPTTGWQIGGPCTTSPFDNLVATIIYITGATPSSCCSWGIDPWPSSTRGEIEIVGCDGFVGFAESHPASLNGYCQCDFADFALGPYKPVPQDGATDVPPTTLLSWEDGCCDDMTLYLSTEPFTLFPWEAIVYEGAKQNPYDPALLPNTTYYWRVAEWADISPHGFDGVSRVWSFTTGDGPVPVERSTWGTIKALYR
jgi:hypothetical protein